MKIARSGLLFLIVLCLSATSVVAQQTNIVKTNLSQAEIDRIVKNFTAKEGEFREALKNYIFNRSASISEIGMGGQIAGTFRLDSTLTFNSQGERFEKIGFAPPSTLTNLIITKEDLENLGGIDPFAIEPTAISLYNFAYLGKEKIDDLDLYVFDVTPKVIPDPNKTDQRLFSGRVWVDDRDLQIVKSKGKALPETKKNVYPVVETWRENVDGKYWFPSYSSSDDELVFPSGGAIKIRLRVKYTDYREGKSEVRVLDDDTEIEDPTPTPSPTPKKP